MRKLVTDLKAKVFEMDDQVNALQAFATTLESKLAEQNEEIIQKD